MVVLVNIGKFTRAVTLLGASICLASAMAAPPQVKSITPAPGTSDVDPKTTAIVVTFDQDMGKGMSWTGGGPHFPKVSQDEKASGWVNPRTCVLAVNLEPGTVYRLGLNSTSYQNFKSAQGEPLAPQTIMFATKGATADEIAMMQAPKIVSLAPANGATNVDSATAAIAITFDQPMAGGMSWTGGGENFPEFAGKPVWSADGRTCTAPVKLKPSHDYHLGINSVSFKNFANKLGVPAEPVDYKFSTK